MTCRAGASGAVAAPPHLAGQGLARRRRYRGGVWGLAVLVGALLATSAGRALAAGSEASASAGGGAAPVPWRVAGPGHPWRFPRDHWSHPGYRLEWWYLTGHLTAVEEPARFGYQLTFFRVGLLPARPALASAWSASDLVMAHAAVSELGAGRHRFGELLYRAVPFLGGFGTFPEPRLAWSRPPAGTETPWRLAWNGRAFALEAEDRRRGFAFRLAAEPAKPPVLHGAGGLSRKGADPGAATLYYSLPRLRTRGTLVLDGRSRSVVGESWMDREFGSAVLAAHQVGWDWFGLRLADGRDLMLYRLRDRTGRVDHASGTLVEVDGRGRFLDANAFAVEVLGTWTGPAGTRYPAGWRLRVPGAGLDLRVEPELADQENRSELVPDLHYWEGAVRALDPAGRRVGEGYGELTGYRARVRPGLG